ncbi:MAG: polysaccharide deacetylase family protein, partial [Christensenellaceae bacterium]|nr:polysaccharide deacetylase family protein [Christensenellaceae bacterium]
MELCNNFKRTISIYILAILLALTLSLNQTGDRVHASIIAPPAQELVELPILMYHAVFPNGVKRIDYSINVNDLEWDIEYIIKEGYSPVCVAELIEYVKGRSKLPAKPILLTFDDGFYSMKELVLPVLRKYKVNGVFAITGIFCERFASKNNIFGYMSYHDVAQLAKSKYVEIAGHSYDMHTLSAERKGMKKLENESEMDFEGIFKEDVKKLKIALSQISVDISSFAYPFGYREENADVYLNDLGISVSFTCSEKIN